MTTLLASPIIFLCLFLFSFAAFPLPIHSATAIATPNTSISSTPSSPSSTPSSSFSSSPIPVDLRLKKAIPLPPSTPTSPPPTVGLIQINQKNAQISEATWLYVKNALDHYKKTKPLFIILELNTPGGEVFSAQKISDALKEIDTQYDIPVVAFINNWAISAGAMLAYSCRFIAVTKDGSMGAAEPVQIGEAGQMISASEKVNSALRADFANRASFFDRNPDIAEAMVDKDIILVFREGKVVRLESEDQIRKQGDSPDMIISSKGKLLTLSAAEMNKYGVADILLPPSKISVITDVELSKGKWPAEKMLLFQHPFFKAISHATVDLYQMDWKLQFLAFLSNPVVSSLLFLGMMMGFYIEFTTPGVTLPGTIGLLCLFLIVLSSFALEVANILELVLLLTGLIIIVVELFLLPTFGLLGFIGVIFFLVGLFGMMLPGIESVDFEFDTKTFNAAGEMLIKRLAWLCGTLLVALGMMFFLGSRANSTFRGWSRLVLAGREQDAQEGYVAGPSPKTLPQSGSEGEAMTTLRPSGKVVIQEEIYEAVSTGDFIEKGRPIRVARIDGNVIFVEKRE